MKKKLVPFLMLFLMFEAAAQEGQKMDEKPEDKEKEFQPSSTVKWNPGSLPLGKISLHGEYNYKRKRSITLGVGIPIEQSTSITLDDERQKVTSKTFSLMAGYRMYLGKKTISGFYFEPYLKYVKNDIFSNIRGDLGTTPTTFYTTSDYSGFGVGAQLGVQFLIGKKLALDFFLLGPEANSSNVKIMMKDITSLTPWDAQDAADAEKEIRDVVDDIPVIGDKINVKVDANARTVTADYKGFLPGLRLGGSIGWRF